MLKKSLFITALSLVLFACEKEEKAYELPPPGPATVQTVSMGSDYSKVIFYNLSTGKAEVRELADWDLALEAKADGRFALMNGGKGVQVAKIGDTTFNASFFPDKADWLWDRPSMNLDSTAIGSWADENQVVTGEVYMLDRTVNSKDEQYKRFQLVEVTDTYYLIRTGNLDGSNSQYIKVEKDPEYSFVYVHLDQGQVEQFEPKKEEWDFMFTRYRYVYYDMNPIVPYEVNGVLLNPHNTTVAHTRSIKFEDLTLDSAKQMDFTSRRDFIGFDWKYYDFDISAYVTDQDRVIVIKNHKDYYFKLRFLDFYDEDGVKGAPTFEMQRL